MLKSKETKELTISCKDISQPSVECQAAVRRGMPARNASHPCVVLDIDRFIDLGVTKRILSNAQFPLFDDKFFIRLKAVHRKHTLFSK